MERKVWLALAAVLTGVGACDVVETAQVVEPAPRAANVAVRFGARTLEPAAIRARLAEELGFTSRGGSLRCSYAVLGQADAEVYMLALCEELVAGGDSVTVASAVATPVAVTVDTAAPAPRIMALRTPGDGRGYGRDVRALFPANVAQEILDLSAGTQDRMRLMQAANRGDGAAASAPQARGPGR